MRRARGQRGKKKTRGWLVVRKQPEEGKRWVKIMCVCVERKGWSTTGVYFMNGNNSRDKHSKLCKYICIRTHTYILFSAILTFALGVYVVRGWYICIYLWCCSSGLPLNCPRGALFAFRDSLPCTVDYLLHYYSVGGLKKGKKKKEEKKKGGYCTLFPTV